jgi:hypothetical protein
LLEPGIYPIDGCNVFLGYDRGGIAGLCLPPDVGPYPRDDPEFPEFSGCFEPPTDALLVAAVCWDSVYRGPRGLAASAGMRSGYRDVRHAYFLTASPILKWRWLLVLIAYDFDNERWAWRLTAATDRDLHSTHNAAYWLLESFWYWLAARNGSEVRTVDQISRPGILARSEVQELSMRVLQPWTPSGRGPFSRPA